MVERLNGTILPQGYLAQAQVHIGGWFAVDVATFETTPAGTNGAAQGGVAIRDLGASHGAGVPGRFSRRVGSSRLQYAGGADPRRRRRVGQSRQQGPRRARRAFEAKCASYLASGVGLIVVDIVTGRSANLHNELMTLIGQAEPFLFRRTCRCTPRLTSRPDRRKATGWNCGLFHLLRGSHCPYCRWPFGARCACRWTWKRRTPKRGGEVGCEPRICRGFIEDVEAKAQAFLDGAAAPKE